MRFYAMVAIVLSMTGCGGGGSNSANHCFPNDPHCGQLTVDYALMTQPFFQTPDAPIPVGASVVLTFQEQRCVGSSQQGGPPPGTGCDPPFVPQTLTAYVFPMGSPLGGTITCPVTVVQTAPGTMRFTRTAPGDPVLGAGNANARGYCSIEVSDPTTKSAPYEILL